MGAKVNSLAVGDAATCNLMAALFSGWGTGGERGVACGGAILLILKAEVGQVGHFVRRVLYRRRISS